jgi:hypothetical protein
VKTGSLSFIIQHFIVSKRCELTLLVQCDFFCFMCLQVDLFAFGMVVYELMLGCSCHSSDSVLQTYRLIEDGKNPLVCCLFLLTL